MVRLAINIARKIIDARMEDDERIYLRIAEKTLAEIKGQKGIQLRCSSKDYPIAVANKEFLISMLEGVDDINIIEDMFLSKGSCVVETEGGMVDGSIDTQIDKIKNAFKSLLEESTKGVHQ
jgi:flagellar assembly protein FliH